LFDTTDKEFSIFMDIYGHLNLSFLTPSAKKKRKKNSPNYNPSHPFLPFNSLVFRARFLSEFSGMRRIIFFIIKKTI